jgi:hypothetical protein
MVEMKVLVMEMMMIMILMKSGAMVMTMVTISPLQEGISLADFCLPESFSLSGVFRPAEAAVSNSEPPSLRFSGTMKYAKGRDLEWARAPSHRAGATQGQAAPPMREAAPWLFSTPPSGFRSLLIKYNFLAFF